MQVGERTITIPASQGGNLIEHISAGLAFHLKEGEVPVRFAVTQSDAHQYVCEVGALVGPPVRHSREISELLRFRQRQMEVTDRFNAVLLVPTGIGAEIGGHAGDATAVARLMAESCDRLVIHPNVVNASDINELPTNSLYVEGSIISRMLMGAIGLQPVRTNRVLVVIDDHEDKHFVNAAINSVSAARATYGLDCPEVVCLNPPIRMWSEYSDSGLAVGRVEGLEHCLDILEGIRSEYDAIAFSSVIKVPESFHSEYFESNGAMVNPWGGVEAMLTHTVSSLLDVPTAHSPMFESQGIEMMEAGIVEPRMSAEAVSLSFLQCILKGLQKSPRIVQDPATFVRPDIFSVEDVSCLVIPAGCFGLPTIAALEQGIPVIAVRENRNIMKNDLSRLPWRRGQYIEVENYLEAVGAMNAMKAGVTLESVRRPIAGTKVSPAAAAEQSTAEEL